MKKILSVLLIPCLFALFFIPATAAREPVSTLSALTFEKQLLIYEKKEKAMALKTQLEALEYVDRVMLMDTQILFPDLTEYLNGCDAILSLFLRPPTEESSLKVRELLNENNVRYLTPTYYLYDGNGYPCYTSDCFTVITDTRIADREQTVEKIKNLPTVREIFSIAEESSCYPYDLFAVHLNTYDWDSLFYTADAVLDIAGVFGIELDGVAISILSNDHCYFGDVNGDSKVSVDDARTILRYAVSLEAPKTILQFTLADMDCDQKITASDARLALRTSVGLQAKNEIKEADILKNTPQGLLSGGSVTLNNSGDGSLIITASTSTTQPCEKCGFAHIAIQRYENGIWTDVKGGLFPDIYGTGQLKTFSRAITVTKGVYRAVCVHFAEQKDKNGKITVDKSYQLSSAVTVH